MDVQPVIRKLIFRLGVVVPDSPAVGRWRHNERLNTLCTNHCPQPFQDQLDGFFRSMAGKNRSPKTILAYSTDLGQFLAWVVDNDLTVETRGGYSTSARHRLSGGAE